MRRMQKCSELFVQSKQAKTVECGMINTLLSNVTKMLYFCSCCLSVIDEDEMAAGDLGQQHPCRN